jgi:hypothetical protein
MAARGTGKVASSAYMPDPDGFLGPDDRRPGGA